MIDINKHTDNAAINSDGTSSTDSAMRVFSSDTLFAGDREVLITHGEKIYRLRITSQGKLVLNI